MYLSFFFPSVSKHSSILHEYAVKQKVQHQVMKQKCDDWFHLSFFSSESNSKTGFLALIAIKRFSNNKWIVFFKIKSAWSLPPLCSHEYASIPTWKIRNCVSSLLQKTWFFFMEIYPEMFFFFFEKDLPRNVLKEQKHKVKRMG